MQKGEVELADIVANKLMRENHTVACWSYRTILFFSFHPQDEEETTIEDATEISQGKPYHWRDWCLVRGRDCLYLWSDSAALELSNGSNGWFRFILDGKLATMYSSGSPEGGSDSSGELAVGGYSNSGESGFYRGRGSSSSSDISVTKKGLQSLESVVTVKALGSHLSLRGFW